MSLLALEESPHFVSLYDATQRGLVDKVLKAPLYPFVYAWLLTLERWRGWTSKNLRLRSLCARPGRLEATFYVGRLHPFHDFVMRGDEIERLTFSVGPEGPREVTVTVRVRYRNRSGRLLRGEARFGVVDVDTHREARTLLMRIARMLGCASYRVLPAIDDDASFAVELLLASDETKASGYRDPGRPADVEPVPDEDEVGDFAPRVHGGFVEPQGVELASPRPEPLGIEVWEPGKRVVAGERGRPWLLALLPLLVVGWLVLWILGAVFGGGVLGFFAAIIALAMSLVGIDVWWLLLSDATTYVTLIASALLALYYVVPPGAALLEGGLGSEVRIDWDNGCLERRSGFTRLVMPLGQVRGVDVRSSLGKRRLLLLTTYGDVALAAGEEELSAVALVLARALDVPVSYPAD